MFALVKVAVLTVSLASAVGLSKVAPSTQDAFVAAAAAGDAGALSRLLDRGAQSNARDETGRTALSAAIEGGHTALVPHLIDLGADVNLTTGEGWSPLMLAARHGQPDVVRELLATGADPQAQNASGWTPLLAAIEGGNEEVVLTLLEETAGDTRHASFPDDVQGLPDDSDDLLDRLRLDFRATPASQRGAAEAAVTTRH